MKYDEDLAYNPSAKALRDIIEYINREGAGKFLYSPDKISKELREKFPAICLAFGWRKLFKREWLIKYKVGDPPDFDLATLTKRKTKNKPFDHVIGELVTIPNLKDDGDYLNYSYGIVRNKLSERKSYEKGTMLLIFINSKYGPEISPKLREFLSNQNKYPMIWLLYFLKADRINGFVYKLEQLCPNWMQIDVTLKDELKKKILLKDKDIESYLPK